MTIPVSEVIFHYVNILS